MLVYDHLRLLTYYMSRICELCGKGPRATTTRSHSRIATKAVQYPNLQIKTIDGKRTKACTRCIKTLAKTR
ncbi:MAG: 50S ribosomal protein L28 [Parcubacteria group bacterium GW2011_GWC2_38_7]|nr:MAG: 50S ribosomal protein L28 [Parcubacteria group bacterium GW2011_GWC2_38_7]